MTTRAVPPVVDEYDEYPMHEEDNVPESWIHEWTVRYLRNVFEILFPGWFVAGNMCIYWQRGNKRRYVAPDVFVVRQPVTLGRRRKNYLLWLDPPVSFVLEIGSDSTRHIDLGTKPETYSQRVKAQEYLFADPPDEEKPTREMRMWRMGAQVYEEVAADANGRFRSEVLGVEFGWDEAGLLRVYADGVAQPTVEEAEAERVEETQRRREAEARVGEELLRREEAEARARAEAEQRKEAEARAAALEQQLAELRARLGEEGTAGGS
jgi:Uma2 family endonuclease